MVVLDSYLAFIGQLDSMLRIPYYYRMTWCAGGATMHKLY